ncbi:MAG: hypothetical protein RL026_493 [Pseudomonadota bacterium]|jgi:outer membrane receptor protein involved in Fe transport
MAMNSKHQWALAAGMGALCVVGMPWEARAQGSVAEAVEEVVVTAQRREQRLQDVPVAVSVVSGEALQRANIKSLQDISGQMGNVRIASGTLTNPINIRGIGSGNNSGFEQSVATFADGVYRPRFGHGRLHEDARHRAVRPA